MILEFVEFDSPKGWSRQQVAEEARNVIAHWQAYQELSPGCLTLRPFPVHTLLEPKSFIAKLVRGWGSRPE